MEIKKSNHFIKEIKLLKEQSKELNFQIDDLHAMLDEKDLEIKEYQFTVK